MRLDNPQLIDILAQRYVIGVQLGGARRRFSAVARERQDVRRAIDYWEARLTPLVWGLEPIRPSDLVWQRICRELGLDRSAPTVTPAARSGLWPAVAAMLTMAVFVTGIGWWQAAQQPPEIVTETVIERVPEQVAVAVVSSDDGQALWLARIAPLSGEALVRTVNDVEARADNDYELWALTDAGVPVSLGLLPQSGARTLSLDDAALNALATSSTLAVSLEPLGGSPEPVPTGPVLYTAALLAP